jgi:hypothetical protein
MKVWSLIVFAPFLIIIIIIIIIIIMNICQNLWPHLYRKLPKGYQFSLKSENIEILPILLAANLKMAVICSRFSLVRIFYQPYLIYMPSLEFWYGGRLGTSVFASKHNQTSLSNGFIQCYICWVCLWLCLSNGLFIQCCMLGMFVATSNLKMAVICSRFSLVRIFYQPYLIYMPSLVEIPLAVSDISEVKDFDICS